MNKHVTFFPTTPPIVLAWEDEVLPAGPLRLPDGDRFLCAQCGAEITHAGLRVSVDGSHRHMMERSFGSDQEHGCFSLAPGCAVHGALRHLMWERGPTAGDWHMVTCANCGAHMGWQHQNPDGQDFFLLILENLRAAREMPDEDVP